jgi:glycine cleavage system H protein
VSVPTDLRYTRDHEWVRVDGDEATVGITQYAADQLGDIVFVELPETGRELEEAKPFGVVESVKAVSDLFAPVSGAVTRSTTPSRRRPSSSTATRTATDG